jgi:hypothetical protein
MKARLNRLIRVIGASVGLGALRDAFLDLEIVSRISVRLSGRATSSTASATRDRSFPPFVGNPGEWVQPGDRVTRPGDATFGWDALRRRAAARVPLTEPTRPAFPDGATEIRCSATSAVAEGSPRPGEAPTSRGYVTCDASNLVIDFDGLYPTRTTRYRPRHKRGPGRSYHRYRAGALLGDCRWSPTFELDTMPRDLLRDIFGSFRSWTGDPAIAYDEVVEHPVLFVTREGDESRNAFHAMTDFLNAFEAVLIASDGAPAVARPDLEVVLLDNADPSWLDPLWPRAFAPVHGVRRVGDFAGRRVLFRRALFNAPGYQSFLFDAYLTRDNARPEPVGLLDAFAALVLRSSGLSPAAPRAAGPLRVTFISRRPYDSHAYMGRHIVNEAACLAALTAMDEVEVRAIDFAQHPLDEQIRIAHDTDLLIGAHGAALTHMLWTPAHAGVIEFVAIDGPRWRMFPNMASWTGRPYAAIDAPERIFEMGTELTVDVEPFVRTARDLAAEVRRRGSLY